MASIATADGWPAVCKRCKATRTFPKPQDGSFFHPHEMKDTGAGKVNTW